MRGGTSLAKVESLLGTVWLVREIYGEDAEQESQDQGHFLVSALRNLHALLPMAAGETGGVK